MAANASDLVRILDPEWKVTYSSPSAMAILGFTAEEMQALPPSSLNHPEEVPALREMRDKISKSSDVHTIVHRARTKTGDYRWLETRVQPLHDGDGRLLRSYAHSRDITDRVELEGKLRELAVTDVLTGLHNRRGFELVAEPALRLAARQQRPAAVLFIDLDGLKSINDRLGHEAGDRAIKELADLMKGTLRSTDHLARLGGDELVAFAPDLDHDGAAALIERLQLAIDDRNRGGGFEFDLAASIGVALHEPRIVDSRERTLDDLLSEADERMYTAKRARRHRRQSLAS
jgi:diguanylate cyclase (GGDEF)-like protein/PAS domain S-box-containing protein